MKIQINLYEHREIDKIIMNNLGLDKSTNPNSLVKDLGNYNRGGFGSTGEK